MTHWIDRRGLMAGGLAMAAGPALAASDTGLVRVALKTTKGIIKIDLDVGKAPITARNFLHYVDTKRFDRSTFYRAVHAEGAPEYGLLQGGLKGDPAKVFKPIAHESTAKTGLTHKDGAVSMACRAPGTATADFFICVGDQQSLDADPTASPPRPGFAVFGQVVEGMDVVRAIRELPTSKTAGGAAMRGEMLSPPVPILTARRVA
jgi:peptidyl-prolyl cis-trans isomerase A (cyclophilin A)